MNCVANCRKEIYYPGSLKEVKRLAEEGRRTCSVDSVHTFIGQVCLEHLDAVKAVLSDVVASIPRGNRRHAAGYITKRVKEEFARREREELES